MHTIASRKTDREIQEDVLNELRWDSRIRQEEVGVEVDEGVVTLTGTVESWAKKLAAKEAAHRVVGVRDVADDVRVKLPGGLQKTDTEIAQDVRLALEWDAFVPERNIRSTVSDGLVTLEGEVNTLLQKEDAARAIRNVRGVKGVNNFLTVAAVKADQGQLRKSIEQALERRAEREAEKVRVVLDNGTVTLEGRVRTWPERTAVLGAVSHAPGVREVRDRLTVNPWN
ncbi:MAG TPA: BON domain-containing protein [Thermoanaerobaculia bacterium]|nr:BON domain-containing protein [Thermoanaerobaculia bacterium]